MIFFGPSRETIREAILDAHYELEHQKNKPLKQERIEECWKPEGVQIAALMPRAICGFFASRNDEIPIQVKPTQVQIPVYRKARILFEDWLERKDGKLTGKTVYSECRGEVAGPRK